MRIVTLIILLISAVPKEFSMQPTKPPIREMVGATSAPFDLGKGVTTISFELHPPAGPGSIQSPGHTKRFLLRLENVKSATIAPSFDIYFNVPSGADPEKLPQLFAFTMSTFGLVESSKQKGHHPGDGLSMTNDVTEIYLHLDSIKNWNEKKLQLSFVPAAWSKPIKVQVGRASLMIE
jgi:hypothetical protein